MGLATELGSGKRPPFFGTGRTGFRFVGCRAEASAAWKFFNFLAAQIPHHKKILRMNMDETACKLFYTPRQGMLAGKAVARDARRGLHARRATMHQKRSMISHVALICDNSTLQPCLPQFLVANERTVSEELRRQIADSRDLL